MSRSPSPPPSPSVAHRILERLTAAKTHVWMLRRRVRGGRLDPAAAEGHLHQIEQQIDEAAALAANLQGQSSPSP
jgi:hypothetical protein